MKQMLAPFCQATGNHQTWLNMTRCLPKEALFQVFRTLLGENSESLVELQKAIPWLIVCYRMMSKSDES